MGLSWQQGPLSSGAIGQFLVPEPLPERLLYVEPLRRRMRAVWRKVDRRSPNATRLRPSRRAHGRDRSQR